MNITTALKVTQKALFPYNIYWILKAMDSIPKIEKILTLNGIPLFFLVPNYEAVGNRPVAGYLSEGDDIKCGGRSPSGKYLLFKLTFWCTFVMFRRALRDQFYEAALLANVFPLICTSRLTKWISSSYSFVGFNLKKLEVGRQKL